MPDWKSEIPGTDKMMELIEEYIAPEEITSLPPMDVSYIRDPGMQGVVALATACKWNVVRRAGKPVILRSRQGTTLAIPTDTSMKFSVFLQRLRGVARDSLTVTITPQLIEQIIARFKLDHDHAREFRKIVADVPHEEETMTDPEVAYQRPTPTRGTRGLPEPGPDAVVVERDAMISHGSDGRRYISEAVLRRVWSDGAVDYECSFCGEAFITVGACSAHFGYHVKRGERPPQGERQYIEGIDREWIRESKRRRRERERERQVVRGERGRPPKVEQPDDIQWEEPAPIASPTPLVPPPQEERRERYPAPTWPLENQPEPPDVSLTTIQIAEAIERMIDQAVASIIAERDAALREVERLKGNLKGLRDLIGEDL